MAIPIHHARRRRALIASGLLVAALSGGLLSATAAHAALMGCTSDPLIMLSNNVQDSVSVALPAGTSLQSFRSIVYTVHIPKGVSVSSIVYTAGMSSIEKVQIYADNALGVYSTTTVAQTATAQTVAATTQVTLLAAGGGSATQSVNGSNGQALTQQVSLKS